jgi:ABC-type proline/glycine betaine transport system permease subunit
MDIVKLIGTAYVAGCFTALGLGALFNGGLRANRGDKVLGLCLLAAAGGLGELTSRLA